MAEVTPRLITNTADLEAILEPLCATSAYAVDTEFHRERTYFAQLALVQIAWDDQLVLVDPLAVDIDPLARVFGSQALCVMHACRQDLEVLERHCGTLPERLADTQLMAGFLGYASPSLTSLLERELGLRLPKADRLTDWLRRPLSAAQLSYAASDVASLVEVYHRLNDRLIERGRRGWFDEAMAELLGESRGARNPDEAWRRIKELRHLRGLDLGVAQRVAAWREERAIEADLTPRHVLGDLAVVGVAVNKPLTVDDLRQIRGVDGRALRSATAANLLAAVAAAVSDPAPRVPREVHAELPSELRPALPLVSAWVSQVSRELEVDAAILATRADLEALLRNDEGARLRSGWRLEVVGGPIDALLRGEVSIAFDRNRGLVLVDRGD